VDRKRFIYGLLLRTFISIALYEWLALSGLLVLRDVSGNPVDDVLLLASREL
jgi:hypothetical protein